MPLVVITLSGSAGKDGYPYMLVYHPQGPYQGNPAENVFCAADDMGIEIGIGFVVLMYQPHIFPERPVNIYFQIDAKPQARHLLLGALISHAMVLLSQFPGQKARIYTAVDTDDVQMIDFFRHSGLKMDDAEDLTVLSLPAKPYKLPMSFDFGAIPLGTEWDQNAFLMRLNAYRISTISMGMLASYGHSRWFLAMAVYKGGMPVGEILTAGNDSAVYIGSLYVQPDFRRIGLGRALISRAADILRHNGAEEINAFVMRRSLIQQRMAEVFNVRTVRATAIYPGINVG